MFYRNRVKGVQWIAYGNKAAMRQNHILMPHPVFCPLHHVAVASPSHSPRILEKPT